MSWPSVDNGLFTRCVNRFERGALVFVAALAVGAAVFTGIEAARFQANPFSHGTLMDWVLLGFLAAIFALPSFIAVFLAAFLSRRIASKLARGIVLSACSLVVFLWATTSPDFKIGLALYAYWLPELAFSLVLGFGWVVSVHAAPLTWPEWVGA